MLGLLPAVSASVKVDEDRENKTNLISEADVLYNEHSYTKLRSLLLPYKVIRINWFVSLCYKVGKTPFRPKKMLKFFGD